MLAPFSEQAFAVSAHFLDVLVVRPKLQNCVAQVNNVGELMYDLGLADLVLRDSL